MTRDTLNLPSTRTWRDIPQPVVPRAMSREGRWRLVMATLRVVAVVAISTIFGWGGWLVFVTLRENTHAMPAAAKATPMKAPELRTDGVLDGAWLVRTLALPPHASLLELDLQQLRARLLADDQVVNATLTKFFPDRLVVQVTERTPVARVTVKWLGQQSVLLVSRDGVIYSGQGYDQSLLDTLPWLDGVLITPENGRFHRIDGMSAAADLLAKARLEAEDLYGTWSVMSLARLASDHKIEIRTKTGNVVFFSTNDDFFRQLAKLDYITEQLARIPGATAKIDLSLGQDVPVMVTTPPPEGTAAAPATTARKMTAPRPGLSALGLPTRATPAHSEQAFFILPHSQIKQTQREL